MLVIVVLLLIFGALVRHKWRNEAAKKEEILKLVALTSEEEAQIAKLQAVESCNFAPEPPSQLENQYCAVCCCPTTTRCSRCKAVRYCSGKCQIIHWRHGHKDDCLPATFSHNSNESEFVVETVLKNQPEINFNNEAQTCFDPAQQLDDTGSSSGSFPCFSSSSESSEISFDASVSEVLESQTPSRPDKVALKGVDSHMSRTSSCSVEVDMPSLSRLSSTVSPVNSRFEANKIKRTQATKPDGGFQTTSLKDKRIGSGAVVLEEFVLDRTDLSSLKSSRSFRTSSSVKAQPSCDDAKKSMYPVGSGHHGVPNVDLRSSKCSKSLRTSLAEDYWQNKVHFCKDKETRSMSRRSSENDEICNKNGSAHNLLSDIEGVQILSQPSSNTLKTSVRKFVQHFKVSKQSKSYTFDMGKDSAGSYNHKIIFPPKLFIQLYSCAGLELHPVGLLNCGNSCYVNAVLQCLTFTRPIGSYLLQGLHSKTCRKRGWCLICEFERLIQKGQEINSPLSPIGILSQLQMIGSHLSHGREEDAHDFLRNVVDTMQSIWLEEARVSGSLAEDSTLLGLTFGGYLRSKIKCMKCLGRSEQCDRMMDLTVEIDGDIYTLEEALAQFTLSETLSGDDKYKCNRCKSYERAKKKLTIIEAPNVLTIVLKRFRSVEKLNKLVQFPEFLNLAPYMSGMSDKNPIYTLYALVVHLNTMNAAYSGHYISYVKDFRGEWFKIDDNRVSHVDLETVLSAEAYILFYARHTPRGPSLLKNSSTIYEGKTKRSTEAFSSSTVAKKTNCKSKPSPSDWMPSHNFTSNHIMDYSSSDTSSIFSASDAGSYSTDSTKDSSADDISGYIFGSSLYHP